MTTPAKTTYQIDAEGKALGRVASMAAVALRGKNLPTFERHILPKVEVTIINASKLSITTAKRKNHMRKRYSGYPGGLKEVSWQELITKKGYAEPLRLAIKGMLPSNRLRPHLMKQLQITE
jgi:large subunit ribosomal protein L13